MTPDDPILPTDDLDSSADDDGGMADLQAEIDAAQVDVSSVGQRDSVVDLEMAPGASQVDHVSLDPGTHQFEPKSVSADKTGISNTPPARPFDDLTLAEALGRLWHRPLGTIRALLAVAGDGTRFGVRADANLLASQRRAVDDAAMAPETVDPVVRRNRLRLGLHLAGVFMALWGCLIFISGEVRNEETQLSGGAPFVLLGMILWVGAEVMRGMTPQKQDVANLRSRVTPLRWHIAWTEIHPLRYLMLGALVVLVPLVWVEMRGNEFRFLGFWAWALSIIAVVVMVAPREWALGYQRAAQDKPQRQAGRDRRWVWVAFVLIFAVGAVMRLHDLNGMPQEMTSDHKEKILDAKRVAEGSRDIFFANNGGREGFQMYAMALLAQVPGLGFNHETLKLLAVLESLITLPAMFWMGRQIGGRDVPERGDHLGLLVMALVAVSYWHLTITRLALRIVLTPLIGALLIGFLARGMRNNRRGDFVAAGLVLGFGLYTYQAVRMMPLMVLAAVGLALLFRRHDRAWMARMIGNLAALVVVSFVVFVPLLRYSTDYPEEFWRRSIGRIFGDVYDDNNNPVDLSFGERLDSIGDNLTELSSNIRNAFLMFNYRGDQGWINGVPFDPQLDPLVGAFFIMGVVATVAVALRSRDPVIWLMPVALFIMLLPSALAIGMTNENPSATRASGAIPPTFVIAAIAIMALGEAIQRALTVRQRALATGVMVGGTLMVSLMTNWTTYFDEYRDIYRTRTWPYSLPGQVIEGFVDSGGAYGNAYMLFYPTWWDYGVIAIAAGAPDWPNGIVDDDIPRLPLVMNNSIYCPGHPYPVDPERDLLFLYHYLDSETELILQQTFPDGYPQLYETFKEEYNFKLFRVPALGQDGFEALLNRYVDSPGTCALS